MGNSLPHLVQTLVSQAFEDIVLLLISAAIPDKGYHHAELQNDIIRGSSRKPITFEEIGFHGSENIVRYPFHLPCLLNGNIT